MTALPAPEEAAVNAPVGETLSVSARVIVSPTTGVFHRLAGSGHMQDGDMVRRGDVIGVTRSLGRSTPIKSPFAGFLMAVVAVDGERLRPGQPVAWLREI